MCVYFAPVIDLVWKDRRHGGRLETNMSPTSDVSGPLRLLCLSLNDLHVTCVNVSGGPTIMKRVGVVILFLFKPQCHHSFSCAIPDPWFSVSRCIT